MRYPEFLKEGGTIGFVAPAFGCATEPYATAFDKAIETFKKLGYRTVTGPNCREAKGLGISNTPELCAKELEDMYLDPANDVLISCGGGELMCTILPYLDFERIRAAKPKWFMGFSDNTNFTFLQATLCDTAAVYGQNAASFGGLPGYLAAKKAAEGESIGSAVDAVAKPGIDEPSGATISADGEGYWQGSVKDSFDFLRGKKTSFEGYPMWEREGFDHEDGTYPLYNLTEKRVLKSNCEAAEFEGRVVGGCLDCLANLVGTCFDGMKEFSKRYESDGVIFFFESCDLDPLGVYRALWQLKNAGWFEHTKTFLVGRPMHYGEEVFGFGMDRAVLEVLGDLNVPIIMDLDIGHLPPRIPMVTGAYAKVKYKGQSFEISYDLK